MGIEIYTYTDPYHIDKEECWGKINDNPLFAASQTLVNGMKLIYGNEDNISTIAELVNSLFSNWTSVSTVIKQHAAIDNIINYSNEMPFNQSENANLSAAFTFNRDEVYKSIRTLFELGIRYENVKFEYITKEQKFLLELYKQLQTSKYSMDFSIENSFSEIDIDNAIRKTLPNYNNQNIDTIVIQGIHQFTPLILKTIDIISKYKNVILIFNYQSHFKNIYETWVNIYSSFEKKINFLDGQVSYPHNTEDNYKGVQLAINLGKLIEGDYSGIESNDFFDVIEFDNIMEFSSYVSDVYSDALKAKKTILNTSEKDVNPLRLMKEQFYSSNDLANSVLKMYYPDQFGERHFLNYPLGQFFVAITQMWNPDINEQYITDLNSILECFSSNIIYENSPGRLNTLFKKALPLFEDCSTMKKMIKRLKKIREQKKKIIDDPKRTKEINRVSYLTLSDNDIDELLLGLINLDDIAREFFNDFKQGYTDFKVFYKNIKAKLEDRLDDFRDIDAEFASIITRVLDRISQVENIEANASFQCLKSTMSIYLQQEALTIGKSNWIVKNFEQIDGDILLSRASKATYHFACLNDNYLIGDRHNNYSWPLDGEFFVTAQNPSDWKFMTYVTSKEEYCNFKRYALFYGLLFNKSKYKLSYIKHDDDKELEMYYLLKMLKHKEISYEEDKTKKWIPYDINKSTINDANSYTRIDYYKYKICHYKFLIESLIEKDTVYKDSFLIKKYLEVLVENNIKYELDGGPISNALIDNQIDIVYSNLKSKYFPFIKSTDEIDIKKNVKDRILKIKKKTLFSIDDNEKKHMEIKELFIQRQPSSKKTNIFDSAFEEDIKTLLDKNRIYESKYYKTNEKAWCKYCPNRELCGRKIENN